MRKYPSLLCSSPLLSSLQPHLCGLSRLLRPSPRFFTRVLGWYPHPVTSLTQLSLCGNQAGSGPFSQSSLHSVPLCLTFLAAVSLYLPQCFKSFSPYLRPFQSWIPPLLKLSAGLQSLYLFIQKDGSAH